MYYPYRDTLNRGIDNMIEIIWHTRFRNSTEEDQANVFLKFFSLYISYYLILAIGLLHFK